MCYGCMQPLTVLRVQLADGHTASIQGCTTVGCTKQLIISPSNDNYEVGSTVLYRAYKTLAAVKAAISTKGRIVD